MDFTSDNTIGASRAILEAIIAANQGSTPAYGADRFTAEASRLLSEVFEREVACFLVATGTAANALALGALTPPWGAVFCHETAHIMQDECGAPEMFTAGAKLIGLAGDAGKIAPADLSEKLAFFPYGVVKQVQPAALSLSQATEWGSVYSCAEIAELSAIAHEAGIAVHLDGARFANALVALDCTPAQMSWRAGVDVLSLGASKNGALACEAVIFFDPAKAKTLAYQRKRSGHTLSKGRFLGAQMVAYLENDHWLDLARKANAQAKRLGEGLSHIRDLRLLRPPEVNEVFAILPKRTDAALRAAGALYYEWDEPMIVRREVDEVLIRLVASFLTQTAEIDRFLTIAREAGRPLSQS